MFRKGPHVNELHDDRDEFSYVTVNLLLEKLIQQNHKNRNLLHDFEGETCLGKDVVLMGILR